jgi:hypothetical protein
MKPRPTRKQAIISMVRVDATRASDRFTQGGRIKRQPPKPVSLPRLRWLEPKQT